MRQHFEWPVAAASWCAIIFLPNQVTAESANAGQPSW